jgi:hypothetical protein
MLLPKRSDLHDHDFNGMELAWERNKSRRRQGDGKLTFSR